jgi:hypothetical protein
MGTKHTPSLFDAIAGEAAKRSGMERTAGSHAHALQQARQIAEALACKFHSVTSDHVGVELDRLGIPVGPWMGSLFQGSAWVFTGERRKSCRASNHGRELKVWRLRRAGEQEVRP